MAETENIAKAAEKVSKELFNLMGWRNVGSRNQNWQCVMPKPHGKKTHPSDVVFAYDDPYLNDVTYVNTDLKSYAAGSIAAAQIQTALQNLALATECTRMSAEWQTKYVDQARPWTSVGMLFVYNHDGSYDGNFSKLLNELDEKSLVVVPHTRLFVVGPLDVYYLANVAHDMQQLRHVHKRLPDSKEAGFLYPHLVRAASRDHVSPVATIETLLGPWQVLRYQRVEGAKIARGLFIYFRGKGETVDEFKYLIDYLFRFQLIDEDASIEIRMPFAEEVAWSNFTRAKEDYASAMPVSDYVAALLKPIEIVRPTKYVDRFLEWQIGMDTRD